ncbi:MAG: teichoic acid ABC transporter ATP-binding protein [Candidatus Moranbacteria bacterium CG10_big_fil_rev_8_21_14_0_10_35_21]|nr:MAG: teichoic acid ABC transporter ATP-binding protein [Candidatus Moranbacteria bacterium CG10_big_fil_rev_8_21_14_0_10_35_21]PJA89009.1 MAG: teichoic acid ABC transporter ATP-binding protein [Candidatus Moranbacteria bacterium CG_4_9_14_3_um_filter_36_9]
MENENFAIKIDQVSKTFRIPHEKINTVRGAFVNIFKQKSFEEFQALNNISIDIKKGEFLGIIGKNGSGKSTLLKILASIFSPNSGEVILDGRISPFLELGIGFNPELSGRDNVYLNATILGMTKKEIDKNFEKIIAFSGLEKFVDQKLIRYSSGMQVRLAFSVAIFANREILLMDEVLAVGDADFQKKCYDYFEKIKGQKTVIFVSHDLDSIKKFCDRTLVLHKGNILALEKPSLAIDTYLKILKESK